MSIITAADLTWNGEEIKSLSEAIYEKVFNKPTLEAFHSIESGIKAKKQIAFLGKLGLVGKKQTSCDTTANPGTISMSEKFWDPEYIGDRFEQCWIELQDSFWIWGLKNGVEKTDLTSTDFANFLEERLGDAMQEAVLRHAWFGDQDATLVTASPPGTVTAGTTIGYFNVINGFWKQLFAIATATAARKVSISRNAQASYAAQAFTAQDVTDKIAETVFQDLKYNADMRLRGEANLVIIATQSLVDQYAKELRSRNIDASFVRIEGGYKSLEFEGISIIPFDFWDRTIRTYYDNGTKYHLPHRAVMTTKEQLRIGTEETKNLSEMDPFYDKDSKKYKVDFAFNLDAKVVEDYMVQVAY